MMLVQIVLSDDQKYGDLGGYINYEFGLFYQSDITYDRIHFPDNKHLGLTGFTGKGRYGYGVKKDEYKQIGEI